MRDIKEAFQRTGEISREVSKKSDWLEDFAEDMYLRERQTKIANIQKEARAVTSVEVARQQRNQAQPSIYEMMSAIVSGNKPKFSSVDEAVKHYQESTGLAQYLKAQDEDLMAAYAALVASAGDEEEATPLPTGPETIAQPVGPATNSAEVMSVDDKDEDEEDEEKEEKKSKKYDDEDEDDEDDEDEDDEDEDDCGFDSLASVISQFRLGIDGASKKKVQ